jgi:PAS domain-containing protein
VAQKEIELILMRQLASYLAVPLLIVDSAGNLIFYNEPAEILFGQRYDETGEMPLAEWRTLWNPTTEDGELLPPERLPLSVALATGRPAHRIMCIRGPDGATRRIEAAAIPIEGQAGRKLGAFSIFWELED